MGLTVGAGFKDIAGDIFDSEAENDEELLRILFSLCTYSLYFREAANLLIDSCFPPVDAKVEKKQKKEKPEKAKKSDSEKDDGEA